MNQFAQGLKNARTVMNPILPTIRTLFKKYLGRYFNEELQLDQITGMGLRNLTLKPRELNEQINPSFPFVVHEGRIGNVKLNIKSLRFDIDVIEITLQFKTPEQLREFQKKYQKQQDIAQQLEQMKTECLKSLRSSVTASMNQKMENKDLSWELLKKIQKNLKINAMNVRIKLQVPLDNSVNFVLQIDSFRCVMRNIKHKPKEQQMPDIKQEVKSDASTTLTTMLIVKGVQMHICEEDQIKELKHLDHSCIMSVCNDEIPPNSHGEPGQQLVINLKIDVRERLKFSSLMDFKQIEINMSQRQLILINQFTARLSQVQQTLENHIRHLNHINQSEPQMYEEPPWSLNQESNLNILRKTKEESWQDTTKIIPDYWLRKDFNIQESVPASRSLNQRQQVQPILPYNIREVDEHSVILEKGDSPLQKVQIRPYDETLLDETVPTVNQYPHLLDVSQSESQHNPIPNWEESEIQGANQSVLDNSQLPPPPNLSQQPSTSVYNNSTASIINLHEEKAFRQLDQGNIILGLKVELILVTIRYKERDTPLENRWIYSAQVKRNPTLLRWVINDESNDDALVFYAGNLNVQMEKRRNDIIEESPLIKITNIKVHQIQLLDVKYNKYQIMTSVINQISVDDRKQSEEIDFDEMNDDVEYHSVQSDDDIYKSVFDGFQSNQGLYSQVVRNNESSLGLHNKLVQLKNQYFGQQSVYYTVQRIFSCMPEEIIKQIDSEANGVLVGMLKISEGKFIFFNQVDQVNIFSNYSFEEQPSNYGIRVQIKHKDITCYHQNQVHIQTGLLRASINQEQFLLINQINEQSFKDIKMPKSRKAKDSNDQTRLQVVIPQVTASVIIETTSLVELYFVQQLLIKKNHITDAQFRSQLLMYLSEVCVELLEINITDILIQKTELNFITTFRSLNGKLCALQQQSIVNTHLLMYHQNLFSIDYKLICPDGSDPKNLQSLIEITSGHNARMCFSFTSLNVYIEQGAVKYLLKLLNQYKVSKQTQRNQLVEAKPTRFYIYFDEIIVCCLDGSPQPQQLQQQIEDTQSLILNQQVNFKVRLGTHLSKALSSIQQIRQDITVNFSIYNLIFWDEYLKTDYVEYGTFSNSKNNIQTLKFRKKTYDAQHILIYKQDRKNREKFTNLINTNQIFYNPDCEGFTISEIDSNFGSQNIIQTFSSEFLEKFIIKYEDHCMINLHLEQSGQSIKLQSQFQNFIVNVGKHLYTTIPYVQRLVKIFNPPSTQQKQTTQRIPASSEKHIIVDIKVNNLWINLFPTFNKQGLLLKKLKQRSLLSNIKARKGTDNTSYYSWIRSVVVVNDLIFQVDVPRRVFQMNAKKIEVYIKNTTDPHISFSNPILLVQPELIIYQQNRKISPQAKQVDKDRLKLLQDLNFLKIGALHDLSLLAKMNEEQSAEVTFQLPRVAFTFKGDSLMATLQLFEQMTLNFKRKYTESSLITQIIEQEQETNQTIQFFGQDDQFDDVVIKEQLNTLAQYQVKIRIDDVSIKLLEGNHFYPVSFSQIDNEDLNYLQDFTMIKFDVDDYRYQDISGYEIYHLQFHEKDDIRSVQSILQGECNIDQTESADKVIIDIRKIEISFGISNSEPRQITSSGSIYDMNIHDKVERSKFSKLFGKEAPSRISTRNQKLQGNLIKFEFMRKSAHNQLPPQMSLDLGLHPVRICMYGATLQFFFNFVTVRQMWKNPQDIFFAEIDEQVKRLKNQSLGVDVLQKLTDQQLTQEIANSQGFDVVYSQMKYQGINLILWVDPIYVEHFHIQQTQITFSYDGSGVRLDSCLKGLLLIGSYNNLVLNLVSARLQKKRFATELEFRRIVQEQYMDYILNKSDFKQQLYVPMKALQNVQQIYYGIKSMFMSIQKDGLAVGLTTGSLPFLMAIADELVVLANAPVYVVDVLTENMGIPFAQSVIRPVGNILTHINNSLSNDTVPPEFLKN